MYMCVCFTLFYNIYSQDLTGLKDTKGMQCRNAMDCVEYV